ncbi:MAG: DNA-binding response regulator [Planctomycetota bacterium]|nr:MAG: DNA-binding response regulator [Planctomycetota bacterium]
MSDVIGVLLVDDHALLRESLADRLATEPGLKVLGTASGAEDALELLDELRPDVVLLDIDMPGTSCFDAARSIRSRQPQARVVFLSAFSNDRYIESALEAHATGYVTKDERPSVVIQAVRSAAADVAYFSPKIQARLVVDTDGLHLTGGSASRSSLLTLRELEVLRQLSRGLSKKEIATLLDLSVKTVSRHAENLMAKLDIHDRVELARFAIREGLAEA